MAFDFPIAPVVGQLYPDPEQPGVPQYRWDGVAWQAASGTVHDFVLKAGDTMSGHLGLPVGPAAEQAVRKDYVDAAIDAIPPPVAVDISGKVNRVGDTMTGVLISSGGGELNAAGSAPSFEVRSSGGSGWAPMAFHVVGSFGANFGMLNNGNFYMGGWSFGAATYQFWTTRDFNYIPVNRAGDTMTGTLVCNGNVQAHGSVLGTYGDSNCHVWYYDAAGNGKSIVYFENASNALIVANSVAGINASLSADGRWHNGRGNVTRNGYSGANGGNVYNFGWDGYLRGYTDDVALGIVQFLSDYRIKKDVADLHGTWETVKLLRPIKYTRKDFTPPIQVEKNAEMLQAKVALAEKDAAYRDQLIAEGKTIEEPLLPPIEPLPIDYVGPFCPGDDIERWGFLAHELQETLVPSAASAEKDAPDAIQSPDPWPVIAALTKALQEAMTRIEELESAR